MKAMKQTIDDMIREVKGIELALDSLEVKGRTNLDIVLGSIQHLEQMVGKLEQVGRYIEEMSKPIEDAEA